MTDALSIDAKTAALLVMDVQVGIVARYPEAQEGLLARTADLMAAARGAGVPVIHVVVGFRPGFPEVSPRNQGFSAIKQAGRFGPDDKDAAIHPAVAPAAQEPVVVKHRVGAFGASDLEMLLRACGATTLILTGIATSGVVLTTLRQAADEDYRLVVAHDCCADADPEVHRVLMEKVFPRQASVVTAAEIIAALA